MIGALLAHRSAHLLLARPGPSRGVEALGLIFHGRLVGFGVRIANNDVATAHDCHPCREEDNVETKTTRNGASSCAIPVSRRPREAGSRSSPVESVDSAGAWRDGTGSVNGRARRPMAEP